MPNANLAIDALNTVLTPNPITRNYVKQQRDVADPFAQRSIVISIASSTSNPIAMGVNHCTANLDVAVHDTNKNDTELAERLAAVLGVIYAVRHARVNFTSSGEDIQVQAGNGDTRFGNRNHHRRNG